MTPSRPLDAALLHATIERLVREALRACAAPAARVAETPQNPPPIVLVDRVVSLEVVDRLPDGATAVECVGGAVVTPAATDRLKQLGIRVQRATSNAHGHLVDDGTESWIADADHPDRAAGYARQLSARGMRVRPLVDGDPLSHARSGPMGVVVSELAAVQVDRFARTGSLCAAAVDSPECVRRLAAHLSPVVWVVDSYRLSASGVIAVAGECLRSSVATTTASHGNTALSRRPR